MQHCKRFEPFGLRLEKRPGIAYDVPVLVLANNDVRSSAIT